ncbi:MAG: HDOD domain-containing protein [Planctomycetaceae bacterium]|nr:HDOD domain-containing protein [Planctomycetaceae bacterium]
MCATKTGNSKDIDFTMDAFLARQPILNRDLQLHGYELLFRNGAENYFRTVDGDVATASLISDAVHIHSLEKLTDGHMTFINFTRNALVQDLYTVLPQASTVVEILESVAMDDELLEACRRVKRHGYILALDDYVLEARFDPLLSMIDILKVEFPALSGQQQCSVVESARQYGFKLLAEKVETPAQYDSAWNLGYDYFQGYFFCKPQMLSARRLPESNLQSLRLLQLVNESEFDIDKVEHLIRSDISLSYKLLRYLNSPVFRRQTPVQSVRHAIITLGQEPLRKWVSVIAVHGISSQKPSELMNTCLIRARFSERLGEKVFGPDLASECFIVGMFSLLDAMLDQPMKEIVQELRLTEEVRRALEGGESPLNQVLNLSRAMEIGDWTTINRLASSLGVDDAEACRLYSESIEWAVQMQPQSSDAI